MSCQIKLSANILNLLDVRRILFPLDYHTNQENWLNHCEFSISPCGDIIAIAKEKRLVVLTGRWNAKSQITNFNELRDYTFDFDDNVTSVLCIPINAQEQNSHVGPDWTCIAIGFQSGFVRFYTEDFTLLLEEHFHDEKVNSLNFQSRHHPRPDICTILKPEEFFIQYSSNVCIINGSHLFLALKTSRNSLIKVHSKTVEKTPPNSTINYRKWGFTDQNSVEETAVAGLTYTNAFDHLLTASTHGGFDTRCGGRPPRNVLILGAGSKPYVGFHFAPEDGAQPVLSDFAKAVASKLVSSLPWFGKRSQAKEKPSVVPPVAAACRFGLCDLRRNATGVVLSPNRKLAAVSDSLGRVVLIDTHKGVAVRMFKGYRDAQCAFVQSADERVSRSSHARKVALFLIIYSPRKGTVEIFLVPGVKVATFAASKNSRLFYVNYGLMGVPTMTRFRRVCQYTAVLADSDGSLKEIVIPFHFALSGSDGERARDFHLLKRLKEISKGADFTVDEFSSECFNTCGELKTRDAKTQMVEFLIGCKSTSPELLLRCCDYFLGRIAEEEAENKRPSEDDSSLKLLCCNLRLLVEFLVFSMNSKFSGETVDNTVTEDERKITVTNEEVEVKETNNDDNCNATGGDDNKPFYGAKEMNNLQKLLDLCALNNFTPPVLKVTFDEEKSLATYLKVFDLTTPDLITVKWKVDEELLYQTGEAIFGNFIANGCDPKQLKSIIKQSQIEIDGLFRLLLIYWENRPLTVDVNLEREMKNFSCVVQALAENADVSEVVVDYNECSKFWSATRRILVRSSKSFRAFMAAIICKGVAATIHNQHSSGKEDLDAWEELSQETCQWGLLIGKLDDVSLLNVLLSNEPSLAAVLPCVKQPRKEIISLSYVLQSTGTVSELVAKWLITGGTDPTLLHVNDKVTRGYEDVVYEASQLNIEKVKTEKAFADLNILKESFPYSLNSDVLLINMCWEYALAWKKEINTMKLLEAATKCLEEITNPRFRVGLRQLFWNAHLKELFKSCCKLVHTVGKLPKEKLCRQDTELSDINIGLFVKTCTEFLNNLINDHGLLAETEDVAIRYEQIWDDEILDHSKIPLADLTLQHQHVNRDLVSLHYQISLSLHMIVNSRVKHSKFIDSLFAPLKALLFVDFETKVKVKWQMCEMATYSSRMDLLLKVIATSIETVTVIDGQIYCTEHAYWLARCLDLAEIWKLDIDYIRRFQTVTSYKNGLDVLGADGLSYVKEKDEIGPLLLKVALRRFKQYMDAQEYRGPTASHCHPSLNIYLNQMDSSEMVTSTPLEDILKLANRTMHCLREDQDEYRLGKRLLNALESLVEAKRQLSMKK